MLQTPKIVHNSDNAPKVIVSYFMTYSNSSEGHLFVYQKIQQFQRVVLKSIPAMQRTL